MYPPADTWRHAMLKISDQDVELLLRVLKTYPANPTMQPQVVDLYERMLSHHHGRARSATR